ncbi:MAG TPA: hypothetical protein VHX59_19070 [Mycobacteriales bacterium]|nr:hypothetical protein [Mycobacteriales bacterium]
MTHTEDRLRTALADYDVAAPAVPEVAAGIQAGIRRRRQQRRWAAIGTTVATVAAVAVTVPLHLDISRERHPETVQAASGPSDYSARAINYAPTWLPPGATEIERIVNEAGRTARVFAAGQRIKVADAPNPDKVADRKHETVSIDGVASVGFPTAGGYELQVPWRSGRWMTVTIAKSKTARQDAIRVAGSVKTVTPLGIRLPVSCTAPVCSGTRVASIYGGPTAWLATIDEGPVELVLSHNYRGPAVPDKRWTRTVHGDKARLAAGKLTVDLGAGQTLTATTADSSPRKLTNDELMQAATSAWPIINPDCSWLGTTP